MAQPDTLHCESLRRPRVPRSSSCLAAHFSFFFFFFVLLRFSSVPFARTPSDPDPSAHPPSHTTIRATDAPARSPSSSQRARLSRRRLGREQNSLGQWRVLRGAAVVSSASLRFGSIDFEIGFRDRTRDSVWTKWLPKVRRCADRKVKRMREAFNGARYRICNVNRLEERLSCRVGYSSLWKFRPA